jgi:hypothetical protein
MLLQLFERIKSDSTTFYSGTKLGNILIQCHCHTDTLRNVFMNSRYIIICTFFDAKLLKLSEHPRMGQSNATFGWFRWNLQCNKNLGTDSFSRPQILHLNTPSSMILNKNSKLFATCKFATTTCFHETIDSTWSFLWCLFVCLFFG